MSAQAVKEPRKERRRSERKQQVVEAWIKSPTATDPTERLEVKALNISRHGLAFSVPTALPEGAFYAIEVLMGEQKIASEIQIVTCRRKSSEQFDVGAEFC